MEVTAAAQTRNPGFRRVKIPYKLHTSAVRSLTSFSIIPPVFSHITCLSPSPIHSRCKYPSPNPYPHIPHTNKNSLSKISRSNPSTSPKPADAPAPSSSSSVDPQAIRAEVEKLVAEGKKAVALHQWEQGVDRYATALDRMYVSPLLPIHTRALSFSRLLTAADGSCVITVYIPNRRLLVGDADPEMAPLLLAYGKALYDLASSQAGVMGREEPVRQEDGKLAIFFVARGTHWWNRFPGLQIDR